MPKKVCNSLLLRTGIIVASWRNHKTKHLSSFISWYSILLEPHHEKGDLKRYFSVPNILANKDFISNIPQLLPCRLGGETAWVFQCPTCPIFPPPHNLTFWILLTTVAEKRRLSLSHLKLLLGKNYMTLMVSEVGLSPVKQLKLPNQSNYPTKRKHHIFDLHP